MPDFEIYIPRVRNDRGVVGVGTNDILASDVRAINTKLKAIDPELRTQFMREAKSIGRQAEAYIKPALPTVAPLSGMNTKGAYGWGNQVNGKGRRIKSDATAVQFRTSTGKNARAMGLQTTSLVSVKVLAPMTVISDIAGRSGSWVGKGYKGTGYSRPYTDRFGNIRRHRLNGQGEAMISGLGGKGSRYAWPSFENHRNDLRNALQRVLDKYSVIANRKFK